VLAWAVALTVMLAWRQKGETPLHAASKNGHVEVVAALLAKGVDVEAKDVVSMKETDSNTGHITPKFKHSP
jgi:hypothetical protein